MTFDWLNVASPLFWIFWAGLFLGAAADRLAARSSRLDRLTVFYLFIALAVAAATCALTVPRAALGAQAPSPEAHWAVFGAGVAVASFAGFRFRRGAGIPLLALAVAVVVALGLLLRPYAPIPAERAEIGGFRVLSTSGGTMNVEAEDPGIAAPFFGSLSAEAVAPMAEVVELSDCYFFLASPRFYGFTGLAAYSLGGSAHRRGADLLLPGPRGPYPAALPALPGMRVRRLVSAPFVPEVLDSYRVFVSRDLRIETERSDP